MAHFKYRQFAFIDALVQRPELRPSGNTSTAFPPMPVEIPVRITGLARRSRR
jgi:hypothetical protein